MRNVLAIALLLALAACSGGKDLATVKDSDPTWALVPDRISAADLPR
jgi:hypothetical protein